MNMKKFNRRGAEAQSKGRKILSQRLCVSAVK
jgi:hypothetical protein